MLIRDRYRLEEVLGRGGMGEVWRGRDEALGRAVAVKLLSAGAGDATAAARFTAEARTAGRLNHPHTVAVYDFGAVDDLLFLVMELVDGHSLDTEVAALRRLAPRQVADWGTQIASGLAAAHREGVVHRDIKPANLLVTRDGTVKIGDFGIARFAHDAAAGITGTGMIIGTATYLAPERALGRDAGPPADLYALGCVLYELLTGRPPFTSSAPTELLHQHVAVAPVDVREHREDIPDALARCVHRLLAKEPGERPTAEETAHELAATTTRAGAAPYATTRPPGDGPRSSGDGFGPPTLVRSAASLRRRPSRRRRSRRTPVLVGAVVVVVTVIAIAVAAASPGTRSQGGHAPAPRPTASAATSAVTSAATPPAPATTSAPPAVPPPPPVHGHGHGPMGGPGGGGPGTGGRGPGRQHHHP